METEENSMSSYEPIYSLGQLEEGKFYRIEDLKNILEGLNLPYSIFSIRDFETWKCLDYTCGKRHTYQVDQCQKCGKKVRNPLIPSPRTRGGGKGPGHRRYIAGEIRQIVSILSQRKA